jgi:hypothetical protein
MQRQLRIHIITVNDVLGCNTSTKLLANTRAYKNALEDFMKFTTLSVLRLYQSHIEIVSLSDSWKASFKTTSFQFVILGYTPSLQICLTLLHLFLCKVRVA